jgi:xanthine dehydrogenase iron-sulfur cluster and FAD-binding subunit A
MICGRWRCYNRVMSRPKAADEIDALVKRKEQIEKRLRAAQDRQKERERLDNERRKLIIGAAVLDFMLANPDSPLVLNLREILDRHVTRPAARALLPPLPAASKPE